MKNDNIEICGVCKGHGSYQVDVGYHKSEYETKFCTNCNGTGKIMITNINLHDIHIPYGDDELQREAWNLQSEIMKKVREFQNKVRDKYEND